MGGEIARPGSLLKLRLPKPSSIVFAGDLPMPEYCVHIGRKTYAERSAKPRSRKQVCRGIRGVILLDLVFPRHPPELRGF